VLLLVAAAAALGAGDDFIPQWNDFAIAMNRYINDLNHGENNYGELKTAVRKLHKIEKQQGWTEIH
jgi:hypothetical protein